MTEHNDNEKLTPERVGEMALKLAQDTAYAAAGIAQVVAEKAKELLEQQRKQIGDKAPEGVDPNFKKFVETVPDQLKVLLDDASRQFHDLAEKGREYVEHLQAHAPQRVASTDADPGAFDLKEAAEAPAEAGPMVEVDELGEEGKMVAEGAPVEDTELDNKI